MITTETIRRDLREIRHYCTRKKVIDEAGERIGNNTVLDTLTKYNAAIRTAPLRLYEIYAGLYIDGCTQEQYAESVGYTPEYIQSLNTKLVKYFQSAIDKQMPSCKCYVGQVSPEVIRQLRKSN